MKIITLWRAALVGILLLLFVPIGTASASTGAPPLAKGGGVYNWGDTIYLQGPLPEELAALPELDGYEAGYICNAKGLFWSDVMVSDCRPAAVKDNTFSDEKIIGDAVAEMYPTMHRSLWNRFGWILMALGVLGLIDAKRVFRVGATMAFRMARPTT